MKNLFDLTGRTALITGGSRGLGLQIAEALGDYGAKIVLVSRKQADLDESVAHLKGRGVESTAIAADLSGTSRALAAQLGTHRNWRDSGELAVLFEGTFDTAFYRMVRDALHADVTLRRGGEAGWAELAALAASHRTGAAAIRLSA